MDDADIYVFVRTRVLGWHSARHLSEAVSLGTNRLAWTQSVTRYTRLASISRGGVVTVALIILGFLLESDDPASRFPFRRSLGGFPRCSVTNRLPPYGDRAIAMPCLRLSRVVLGA